MEGPFQHPSHSKNVSISSYANSAYSQAGSTTHILAGMSTGNLSDYDGLLKPRAPFANNGGRRNRDSRDNFSVTSGTAPSLSLSINYLPSKFTSGTNPSGARNRKGGNGPGGANFPKTGGGLEAFKPGESRIPQGGNKLRWNKFKWILFTTNLLLTLYSLAALVVCLLIWFDIWEHADVIRLGNNIELVLSTVAASLGILASMIGWAGLLLNNRGFLAWYTFLCWVSFGLLVAPGYVAYRKRRLNLEGKVNAQWSQQLGADGRARIQDQLKCCGYFSPFIEATITQTCYARSILPGCKLPYLKFQRMVLSRWALVVFATVPAHLAVMISALLCSNHITYRFGKGMMPEAYRLNPRTMSVIMENYAEQLAEQYGADIAADILKRTRANANQNQSTLGLLAEPRGESHGPMSPSLSSTRAGRI